MAFEIDVMTVVLWLAAAALAVVAWRKGEGRLRAAFATTGGLMAQVATRMPLALLMAGFLSQIMPGEMIAGAVGERSGITGIAIASLAGGLVPSGPFVSFPVALTLLKAGAGMPPPDRLRDRLGNLRLSPGFGLRMAVDGPRVHRRAPGRVGPDTAIDGRPRARPLDLVVTADRREG